jgi:hypothetical protein
MAQCQLSNVCYGIRMIRINELSAENFAEIDVTSVFRRAAKIALDPFSVAYRIAAPSIKFQINPKWLTVGPQRALAPPMLLNSN